MQRMNNQSGS